MIRASVAQAEPGADHPERRAAWRKEDPLTERPCVVCGRLSGRMRRGEALRFERLARARAGGWVATCEPPGVPRAHRARSTRVNSPDDVGSFRFLPGGTIKDLR